MRVTSDPQGYIWAALPGPLQFHEQGAGDIRDMGQPHTPTLLGQETLEFPLVQQARWEAEESRGVYCIRAGVRVTLPCSQPGRATGIGCGTELSRAGPGAGLCTGLCQTMEWLHGCCKGWEGH